MYIDYCTVAPDQPSVGVLAHIDTEMRSPRLPHTVHLWLLAATRFQRFDSRHSRAAHGAHTLDLIHRHRHVPATTHSYASSHTAEPNLHSIGGGGHQRPKHTNARVFSRHLVHLVTAGERPHAALAAALSLPSMRASCCSSIHEASTCLWTLTWPSLTLTMCSLSSVCALGNAWKGMSV